MLFKPDEFSIKLKNCVSKFDYISPQLWLALCIFGEARGCSEEIKNYVALTVLTRRYIGGWYGNTIMEVVTKNYQFSCFNPEDPNFVKIQDPFEYELDCIFNGCIDIAGKLLNTFSNPYNLYCLDFCPTHFYSGSIIPVWANDYKLIKSIKDFNFYRTEKL
jgi:hypothetical protein